MVRHTFERRRSLYLLATAIIVLPAFTSTLVLGTRVLSLFEPAARYMQTTGGEPVSILNVMKLQRGLPLYQDPRDPPYYATTLYNAGFYSFYAMVTWPFRNHTAELVLALRLVTLALAGSMLVAMVGYALRAWNRQAPAKDSGLVSLAMAAMAVTTFLGPLTGWWVITMRPDMGGAVFAGFGLLLFLSLQSSRPKLAAVLAGCFLAAAWSFKQSIFLIAAGLVLAALWRRQYLLALLLALPPALTVVGCVLCLGPDYLANVAWATSLPSFTWHNLARMAVQLVAKGALPFAVSVAGVLALRQARWLRPWERLTLACCWLTTLVGGLAACFRDGADANYYFELWVMVGLLAMLAIKALFDRLATAESISRLGCALGVLSLLAIVSAGLDVARLAGLAEGRLGTLRITLDRDCLAELDQVGIMARLAGGDVYCQPALWGLAFDPRLPAPNFDDYGYFHRLAAARGLLRGVGPDGLLAQHFYPLVVLDIHNDPMLVAAKAAGYVRQPGWNHVIVLEAPSEESEQQARRDARRTRALAVRAN